ncbi:hypothetical protein [Rhodospirillum sp. A1_3_36]|uniref:hypothetical protein n=1 Tax=Rhodospirillum sp. A1_3_36 TaxID=3391666 RepID=UPI0039A4B09D
MQSDQLNRENTGNPRRSGTASIAAGGGGGGIVVYLINTYAAPDLKELLMYFAPVTAIGISTVYSYLLKSGKGSLNNWTIRRELNKARAHLNHIEGRPGSSEDLKSKARQKVEALELTVMNIHTKRVEVIIKDE